MKTQAPSKRIMLMLPKEVFFMGEAIPLTVTYTNVSNETVEFRQPEKNWVVFLSIGDEDAEGGEELPFGKKSYREVQPGLVRIAVEEADTVSLKPGDSYRFNCDLWQRWPDILAPGNHTLQVIDDTDDALRIASNALKVYMSFEKESVPKLLAMAADTSHTPFYRGWATEWLQKIKSDFRLRLPEDGETESLSNEDASFNSQQIDRFSSWWKTAQHSSEVNEVIRRVNVRSLEEKKE